jgi:hypothetical protein
MTPRILLGALIAIGIMSGSAAQGTIAHFSTVVTSQGNQFSAGTLRIDDLPMSSTLSMSNLIAGDNFDAQLVISNPGTLDLTYAMTTSFIGSTDLADDLLLTVRAKTSSACSVRDGSLLYNSGSLNAGAFGDPAHGVQAGDRALAAGASESLCFTIVLPALAPATDQGTSLAATFAFLAEQS